MDRMTPAADVPLDLWERVLSINLYGPFLACRRAIPLFLEQFGFELQIQQANFALWTCE
jgi:NAD(P)-dependent dehydrogenase (short-subunit alcohol dehydrogenase family)